MSKPNPKVDFYFNKNKKWPKEVAILREIALASGLTEELKWGCPCYALNETNVFLIHDFNDYCAYLFMKGALLKDPKKILIQQTKNVQSARQIRFTSVKEITAQKSVLKAYIAEAIKNEKAGQNRIPRFDIAETTDYARPTSGLYLHQQFTKRRAIYWQ